jgi:hypothetical protein
MNSNTILLVVILVLLVGGGVWWYTNYGPGADSEMTVQLNGGVPIEY